MATFYIIHFDIKKKPKAAILLRARPSHISLVPTEPEKKKKRGNGSKPPPIHYPENDNPPSPISRRVFRSIYSESSIKEIEKHRQREEEYISKTYEGGKSTSKKLERNLVQDRDSRRNEKGTQTVDKCTKIHPSTRNVGVKTDKHKITFGSCGRERCWCCPYFVQSRNYRISDEKTDPEKTVTTSCGVQTTPKKTNSRAGSMEDLRTCRRDSTSTNDSNKRSGTFKGVFELGEPNLMRCCQASCKGDCSKTFK